MEGAALISDELIFRKLDSVLFCNNEGETFDICTVFECSKQKKYCNMVSMNHEICSFSKNEKGNKTGNKQQWT